MFQSNWFTTTTNIINEYETLLDELEQPTITVYELSLDIDNIYHPISNQLLQIHTRQSIGMKIRREVIESSDNSVVLPLDDNPPDRVLHITRFKTLESCLYNTEFYRDVATTTLITTYTRQNDLINPCWPVYKAFVYTTPDQIHYGIKVCDRTHGTLAECVLNYNITEFERMIYIVHTLLNQLHVLGFSHGAFSWDHVYFTNTGDLTRRHYMISGFYNSCSLYFNRADVLSSCNNDHCRLHDLSVTWMENYTRLEFGYRSVSNSMSSSDHNISSRHTSFDSDIDSNIPRKRTHESPYTPRRRSTVGVNLQHRPKHSLDNTMGRIVDDQQHTNINRYESIQSNIENDGDGYIPRYSDVYWRTRNSSTTSDTTQAPCLLVCDCKKALSFHR